MKKVEEDYEDRLRKEEQAYEQLAQDESNSSLNFSGNSVEEALRDAINTRQTEL